MIYPIGNVWPVGDSKTYGVTDPPGSCGPRDPLWAFISASGANLVGTLTGGADGAGGNLTPCPISGLALHGDGHSGFHCSDVTANIGTWFAAIAGTPPKAGIFYVGTNDLIAISVGSPGFSIDRLYTDFATCLQTAVALNPLLTWFVCNMDPMPALLSTIPADFFAFNRFVGAQVKQYQRQGFPMYLVDLFTALSADGSGYNSGGIHQTVAGYHQTANRMQGVLQTLNPSSDPI